MIAWPVAWQAMRTRPDSFIFHVDLDLWLFATAGSVALLTALLAVVGQAMIVTRQKPVLELSDNYGLTQQRSIRVLYVWKKMAMADGMNIKVELASLLYVGLAVTFSKTRK